MPISWQTNHQIAEEFGFICSAVSRRIGVFENMLSKSTIMENQLNRVKSLTKI